MKFSYNWLQLFFQKKLPNPEKLADLLMMHTLEVEDLIKKSDDWILDIDVLPDRMPDCSSHIGIAREISAILGYKFKAPEYKFSEEKKIKTADILKIEIKSKDLCQRYCARIIDNVKVAPSPKWLKQKIESCGVQSINNIVDAANYIMLETGQPLHAFDYEKLFGKKEKKEIIVRKAKRGEKITTLEDKKYTLDKDNLVIADAKYPIAIAGIKGGKKAEIKKNTKRIILESANFNGVSIYRTSKKLKLQTDASMRFSANIDPNLAREAIDKVAGLIKEIAGGDIKSGVLDFYPKKTFPNIIKIDLNYLRSLLGIKISKDKVVKIFKDLGFEIQRESEAVLILKIPTFRRDICIPEDLIEEVGRIFGYENIPSTFSILQKALPPKNLDLLWVKKIRTLMKGLGFTETYNYSFISDNEGDFFKKLNKKLKLTELGNPISSNTKYLRFSLICNLLKAVTLNQKRFKDVRFFEIGNIFKEKEKRFFAGIIAGKTEFYELKGLLESFFEELGMVDVFYGHTKEKNIFWEKGKSAEIETGNKKIGFLGEVSKKILGFYNIKIPVFAFEINFKTLLDLIEGEHEYKKPSVYPETIRDISVVVPENVLAGEIIQKIYSTGGEIIRNVEVFDIYQEDINQKEKNKSLSFHIIYQSEKKTLSSKEVDKVQKNIIKNLEKNPQWKVRK